MIICNNTCKHLNFCWCKKYKSALIPADSTYETFEKVEECTNGK